MKDELNEKSDDLSISIENHPLKSDSGMPTLPSAVEEESGNTDDDVEEVEEDDEDDDEDEKVIDIDPADYLESNVVRINYFYIFSLMLL